MPDAVPVSHGQVVARPIPIDLRAMRAQRHSRMAIGFYAWSTYRVMCLPKPKVILGGPAHAAWRYLYVPPAPCLTPPPICRAPLPKSDHYQTLRCP